MSSYVSATFEKDYLATSSQVRVITRSRDDGDVPPDPSATYYPTDPDDLQSFIVAEYVSDVVGERFDRVATTTDLATITERPLNTLVDINADFNDGDGVQVGDILEVILEDPSLWTSTEYPGTNPFSFQVQSVESTTILTVLPAFPSFIKDFNYSIGGYFDGITGVTRREGNPAGPVEFLENRFASFFADAVAAENFVEATKADLDTLATDTTGATLVDENYTGASSI